MVHRRKGWSKRETRREKKKDRTRNPRGGATPRLPKKGRMNKVEIKITTIWLLRIKRQHVCERKVEKNSGKGPETRAPHGFQGWEVLIKFRKESIIPGNGGVVTTGWKRTGGGEELFQAADWATGHRNKKTQKLHVLTRPYSMSVSAKERKKKTATGRRRRTRNRAETAKP